MGANLRAACLLTSILFALTGRTFSAVTVSPADEMSYSQSSGSAPAAAVRLTKVTFHITSTEATFTIITEAEGNLGLFHVYLDTDGDAATGYQPPSRKAGDLGADYLVEGGTLHVWDGGTNHGAWSWKAVCPVTVVRGPQGAIQVSVPTEKLNLKDTAHLRVLVETLTEKWESADTLPRQGVWDISKGGNANPVLTSAPVPTSPAKPLETVSVDQAGQPSANKSASLVHATASFQ
jgi:hypothetical protein